MTKQVDPKSFAELERQAAAGDPRAIYRLGLEYETEGFGAYGVRKYDPRKAVRLFRQAAKLGNTEAMLALAYCLTYGHGVRMDLQAALAWEKRADRLGDLDAAFNLGLTYLMMGKHGQAVRWFRKALAEGEVGAGLEPAKAELLGLGTKRDVESALQRLKKIAWSPSRYLSKADREEAAILGATVYLDGWLVPYDRKKAIRWLEKAAGIDSRTAIAMLADL